MKEMKSVRSAFRILSADEKPAAGTIYAMSHDF